MLHSLLVISQTEDVPQTNEKRVATERKNTFSGQIGFSDPWLGVAYERFLFKHFGLDAAVGIIGGSAGVKYYLMKPSEGKSSIYVGGNAGLLLLVGVRYYPHAGYTYLGKSGFRISADIGPLIEQGSSDPYFGCSVRLGYNY